MPSSSAVNVAPLWAATWRPYIPIGGMQIMPADLALVAMVAGRWAEYEPCPGADEPSATVEHLRRMRDDGEVDGLAVVSLGIADINATLGWRSPDAIAGMLVRARHMTNDGEPLYRGVEQTRDTVHFHISSGRAMVPAHRRLAPMMRGRGTRGLLSDHSYASLEPGYMSRFASALSAPVYARARSWLHAPGDAGLPRSGVDLSDDGNVLRMTVPAGDVMRRLGLWGRDRPSVVDGIIQLVALDLARVDLHVSVTYEATRGRRADTAHIVLSNVPFGERPVPFEPDALSIGRPEVERTGRLKRVTFAARAAMASVVVEPVPAISAPSLAKRPRMGAAIAPTVKSVIQAAEATPTVIVEGKPTPTVDLDAPIPPMPEPDFSCLLEKPEREPVAMVTAAEASDDADSDEDDDEPMGAPEPHDGWGWQRDDTKDNVLWGGSELLAHLDERGDGFDFLPPGPHDRPLPLPGDVHSGPPPRDDTRPSWLVRHLPYSVPWLYGAWTDRPVSGIQANAMASWVPRAVWMPGMGAQPAHVWSADDMLQVTMRAMDRRRWQDIRSRLANGESEEGILGQAMASDGYADLDRQFGGADAEPWDAHLERPDLSPRDAYFADLAEQRTRDRAQAARAAREAKATSPAA